ncbi:MAG: hypothetical protein LZF61_00920 [Nitrosomonas sp.]|nr:MAG: hypothetical protein LZF61_00920 [Nitrosomonas sp.]
MKAAELQIEQGLIAKLGELKQRRVAELALMVGLLPYLQKLAGGREISGLNAYEEGR